MYRVFECIDELVALIETARGMPMSGSCVVPRSLALDLLDDLREALPRELPDAQTVMSRSTQIVADAEARADQVVGGAEAERDQVLSGSQSEAHQIVADAREQAERMLADAHAERERQLQASHDEHDRLVAQTEVYLSAARSAEQIHGDAVRRSDRMRTETDSYVDERLAAFADLLTKTLRSVENGRAALRTEPGDAPGADPVDRPLAQPAEAGW